MACTFNKCSPTESYTPPQKSSLTESLERMSSSLSPEAEYTPATRFCDADLTIEDVPEFSLNDDIMWILSDLVTKKQMNCRKELNSVMVDIEQLPHLSFYLWTFFILYPDMLLRYLRTRECVGAREYSSAIARCIQHHKTAKGEREDWYLYSINHLLNYKGNIKGIVELKILPDLYPVDKAMYLKAKKRNIRDLHYEKLENCYVYQDLDMLDENDVYIGHRDCYHALVFSDELLKDKYIKYALQYNDCTGDAIKDFVGVSKETDLKEAIRLFKYGRKI